MKLKEEEEVRDETLTTMGKGASAGNANVRDGVQKKLGREAGGGEATLGGRSVTRFDRREADLKLVEIQSQQSTQAPVSGSRKEPLHSSKTRSHNGIEYELLKPDSFKLYLVCVFFFIFLYAFGHS